MNPPNLFRKLAVAGIVGAVAATGITTSPAQAFVFKDNSSLGWTDTTTDFYDDVDENINGDTFSFTFLDPALVTNVGGSFLPGFMQGELINFDPSSNLTLGLERDFSLDGTTGGITYVSTNMVNFHFGEVELMEEGKDNDLYDLQYIIPEDTNFLLDERGADNIELSLCLATCEERPYWAVTPVGGGETWIVNATNTIDFQDNSDNVGGTYGILSSPNTTYTTPEPGTILGLLAISGLGLGLKRKKQS